MTAQVTEVNKALLIVFRIAKAGNRAIFDEEGNYIDDKSSGECRHGMYMLKMWVHKDQSPPF